MDEGKGFGAINHLRGSWDPKSLPIPACHSLRDTPRTFPLLPALDKPSLGVPQGWILAVWAPASPFPSGEVRLEQLPVPKQSHGTGETTPPRVTRGEISRVRGRNEPWRQEETLEREQKSLEREQKSLEREQKSLEMEQKPLEREQRQPCLH